MASRGSGPIRLEARDWAQSAPCGKRRSQTTVHREEVSRCAPEFFLWLYWLLWLCRTARLPPRRPTRLLARGERTYIVRPDGSITARHNERIGNPAWLIMSENLYFTQTTLPLGRPKLNKPLNQMTREEILARLRGVVARQGTYKFSRQRSDSDDRHEPQSKCGREFDASAVSIRRRRHDIDGSGKPQARRSVPSSQLSAFG